MLKGLYLIEAALVKFPLHFRGDTIYSAVMSERAPARKRGGKRRRVIGLEVLCPMSGVRLGKQRVAPHKTPVLLCDNGSLMGHCPIHQCRSFIGESSTVEKVKQNYQIALV